MSPKLSWQPRKWLHKKSKAGFRGFPIGTIAFYGPDDQRATKATVGVIVAPDTEPAELRTWSSEQGDVRADDAVLAEIASFLREHDVRSLKMTKGIIGCPHEEGIDYPEGETCPQCPFWAGRDRWAGA